MQINNATCPCGKKMDSFDSEAIVPGDGDILVCYYCEQLGVFKNDGLFKVTPEMIQEIKKTNPQKHRRLMGIIDHVRRVKTKLIAEDLLWLS